MNRMKHSVLLLVVLLCAFGCAGVFPVGGTGAAFAAQSSPDDKKPIRSVADLNRRRLGVISGTSLDILANSALDFTQIFYYDSPKHQIEALFRGDIDASIDDLPVNAHFAKNDPRLYLLPEVLVDDHYAFAMRFSDSELYEKINSTLTEMLENGSVAEMQNRWIEGNSEDLVMEKYAPPEAGRVISFGISSISPPFCYPGPDGEPVGMEIELMRKIADTLHLRLRVVDMDFSELIPSLLGGKVDIIGSCISVTPEREEIIRFTESYYDGGVSAVVLKDPAVHSDKTE